MNENTMLLFRVRYCMLYYSHMVIVGYCRYYFQCNKRVDLNSSCSENVGTKKLMRKILMLRKIVGDIIM